MSLSPVKLPAGYAPAIAVGYADDGGNLVLAGLDSPLPVSVAQQAPASMPAPLTGSASSSTLAGPFLPVTGEPIILQLDGIWTGAVRLLRAPDSSSAAVPVTMGGSPWARFSTNVCEPVWEETEAGARLYLEIALDSGSVTFRVSQ